MSKNSIELNLKNFWVDSDYARKEYVGAKITTKMIQSVEQETGYKLPASYITLLQSQNGGIPGNTSFPTNEPTSWAEDHVAITGIFGIDASKTYSLLGSLGSEFMKNEWGYPDIGIYVCDCPSAGHDMIALDYRECGKKGEPAVVHVDQESDFKITFLSLNFKNFIEGLVHDEVYDKQASEDAQYLWKPDDITFELKQANKLLNMGLMLELNQNLAAGETGWSQSRLNVPENWKNAILNMNEGRIQIIANEKVYYIDKANQGTLSFEILNAGEISDKDLEIIWDKYAKET